MKFIYRKIPKVSPGLTFDIGANLVGLLSGVLTIGWAYFRWNFLSLKFGGPTIRWAYYPVGLLSGFYGM